MLPQGGTLPGLKSLWVLARSFEDEDDDEDEKIPMSPGYTDAHSCLFGEG
jgi:hypothetical protein